LIRIHIETLKHIIEFRFNIFFYHAFSFLKADQQSAGVSESSTPPMGGTAYNIFYSLFSPAHHSFLCLHASFSEF